MSQTYFCQLKVKDTPVDLDLTVGDESLVFEMKSDGKEINLGKFKDGVGDLASALSIPATTLSPDTVQGQLASVPAIAGPVGKLMEAEMWITKLRWEKDEKLELGFRVSFEGLDDPPEVGNIVLQAFGADLEFDLTAK